MKKWFVLISLLNITFLYPNQYVSIGTGGIKGLYYPTGSLICALVNKNSKKDINNNLKCLSESTAGSIFNINAIKNGNLDMAIVQSDWQYHAYNGTGKYKNSGKFKDLRSLFSIYAEPFTIIARKDSNIKNLDDLKGKRVNIGNPGSGQRGTMEVLMETKGWTKSTFSSVMELSSFEQSTALCDNKVDAIIFTVGHPSKSVKEATNNCDSRLVNIDQSTIDQLVKNNNYYRMAIIPGNTYKGNPNDIKTFGVGATFVSSTSFSEKNIYHVVKSVFENFEIFKRYHPSLSNLKQIEMIQDSLTAPLHNGAIKYYKEIGLIKN